jgi:hypothetical protein
MAGPFASRPSRRINIAETGAPQQIALLFAARLSTEFADIEGFRLVRCDAFLVVQCGASGDTPSEPDDFDVFGMTQD